MKFVVLLEEQIRLQTKPLHAGTKGCAFLVFLAAPYFVQTNCLRKRIVIPNRIIYASTSITRAGDCQVVLRPNFMAHERQGAQNAV